LYAAAKGCEYYLPVGFKGFLVKLSPAKKGICFTAGDTFHS
jgi:hypothetical protein